MQANRENVYEKLVALGKMPALLSGLLQILGTEYPIINIHLRQGYGGQDGGQAE